jgi:hypothetical protein
VTLERLRHLLEAYGADPERWPAEEREAALGLLAVSPEAQAARVEAARLDALLGLASAAEPSPDLSARILAALPEDRRPARARRARIVRRVAAALVPLAAAAALVLWIGGSPEAPTPDPTHYASWDLDLYATPTDQLLSPAATDVYGAPSFECDDWTLACPELGLPRKPARRSQATGSSHA